MLQYIYILAMNHLLYLTKSGQSIHMVVIFKRTTRLDVLDGVSLKNLEINGTSKP